MSRKECMCMVHVPAHGRGWRLAAAAMLLSVLPSPVTGQYTHHQQQGNPTPQAVAPIVYEPDEKNAARVTWHDEIGDALWRPMHAGSLTPARMPDLRSVSISGWAPTSGDPFSGEIVRGADAVCFRIDLEIDGFVNPPGTIGLNNRPYEPFRYGASPLYGFIEIDIDQDIDTGGELGEDADRRYLANVGRFGGAPSGPAGHRALRTAGSNPDIFLSGPAHQRSGADFALVLDGLFSSNIMSGDDGTGVFQPGDTWVIRGRFFRRSGGYIGASKSFNGSEAGLYDPFVSLRFSHVIETKDDPLAGITTVSLVYALTMEGAALLTGQPQQPANLNVADHTSVQEAMLDVINRVEFGNVTGPSFTLSSNWGGRIIADYLDPTTWRISAIIGTASPIAGSSGLYVFTDSGFDVVRGDMNGDGVRDILDRFVVLDTIDSLDGAGDDDDDAIDGIVTIRGHPLNFHICDFNSDGAIDIMDADEVFNNLSATPVGDLNQDGIVNAIDLSMLLGSWGPCAPPPASCDADFNGDGIVNAADLATLLGAWTTSGMQNPDVTHVDPQQHPSPPQQRP